MIKLTAYLFKQLSQYCIDQFPNEACGVFYGHIEEDHILIIEFKPVANIAKQPSLHFEFEREHFIQLLYKPHEAGVTWVGIFHSHPHTVAYPSQQDLCILWNLPVYVIVSLEQPDEPIMKSYEIKAGKQKKPCSIKEQAIEIIME
jgi:proteasome lid subunit RPN8/RPN11